MPKPRGDSIPTQLRMASHDMVLINSAAQVLGISKNSFMAQASIEKAHNVMDSVDPKRYRDMLEAIAESKPKFA